MMQLAVRYGAISVNPVREVDSIEAQPKNPPGAIQAKKSPPPQTPNAAETARSEPTFPT